MSTPLTSERNGAGPVGNTEREGAMCKTMRMILGGASLVAIGCRDVVDPPMQFLDIAPDAAVVAAGPATEIFFTDAGTGKIWRVTMTEAGVVTSATPILQRSSPVAIALDPVSGKMWWTDVVTGTLERALSSPPFTVDPPVLSGLSTPVGIALDVPGGKIYWVEETAGKIHRANLGDGSQKQLLVSGLGDGRYIALDGVGRMYWSDATRDQIARANTDGTNIRVLVSGQIGPYGIALDRLHGIMYWTDNSLGTMQWATKHGIQPPFVTGPHVVGIALDLARGKIYWAANWEGKIQRSNLDGTHVEDLVTGLVNPHGIALR